MCYTETKQPTMISLRHLHVNAPFSYLWLKYVSGVNLRVHCARCLLGEYDPRISARVKELHEQPLRPSPYYYLCGVSKPYVWSRNFHLAFREKEGSLLSVSRQGIQVEIENAEEIGFSQADIDPSDPHARSKAYFTCRNWQFAHLISKQG